VIDAGDIAKLANLYDRYANAFSPFPHPPPPKQSAGRKNSNVRTNVNSAPTVMPTSAAATTAARQWERE